MGFNSGFKGLNIERRSKNIRYHFSTLEDLRRSQEKNSFIFLANTVLLNIADNYSVISTDKQNCADLIQCVFIQYCYMFWAVYISHHQVGIRSQKEFNP